MKKEEIISKLKKNMETKFTLDVKPISINQYFQGRKFLTTKGKKFQELCGWLIPKKRKIEGLIKIEIEVGLKKNWLRNDIDNFLKPLLDCCVKRDLIQDDSLIVDLRIKKKKTERDYVEVKIKNVG